MTTIDLGSLPEAAAQKVEWALNGETYMSFRVQRGLTPGGVAVTLETDYEGTLGEIAGMAMHVMAMALYCTCEVTQ
jgi:hypothetical protein